MADPTAFEQLIIELVNRARLDPLAEAARYGIDLNQGLAPGTLDWTPKQPLRHNDLLQNAADAHSTWMLATDTFSHTGSGGSSATQRMQAAGYVLSGSWTTGENIAVGMTTGAIDQLAFTFERHEGLFKSSGHRTNILNDAFREIGAGIELGDFPSNGTNFNAQMLTEKFARSGTNAFITGVTYNDADADRFYDVGEGVGGRLVYLFSQAGAVLGNMNTMAAGGYGLGFAPGGWVGGYFWGAGINPYASAWVEMASGRNVKLDLLGDGFFRSSQHTILTDGAKGLELIGIGSLLGVGNDGANTMIGGTGANHLEGRGGVDSIRGGGSVDTILGGDGDDVMLAGDEGNDIIYGGAGADTIAGGTGDDYMLGEAGADRFVFTGLGEIGGADAIADFQTGQDKIALSGLPNLTGPLVNGVTFFAGGPFGAATTTSAVIYYTAAGGVFYDSDGVGALGPTFVVQLAGAPALSASDILVL